jgi:hypothetical protein
MHIGELKNKKIKKSQFSLIIDFFITIHLLKQNIDNYQKGSIYSERIIYVLLRSLLTDKSKESKALIPVISEFIDYKFDFEIFETDFKEIPVKGVITQCLQIFEKSTDYTLKKIDIHELLDKDVLVYQDIPITLRSIIENCANNLGGAHVNHSTIEYLEFFRNTIVFGDSFINRVLIPLSKSLVSLSHKFLSELSSFELELMFYIPPICINDDIYFIDIFREKSNQRFYFRKIRDRFEILIRDETNNYLTYSFGVENLNDSSNTLRISCVLNENLSSQLKIVLNNNTLTVQENRNGVLYYNDLTQFNVCLNAINGDKEKISKGTWVLLFITLTNDFSKLSIDHFKKKFLAAGKQKVPVFNPNSFVVQKNGKDFPTGLFCYMLYDPVNDALEKLAK